MTQEELKQLKELLEKAQQMMGGCEYTVTVLEDEDTKKLYLQSTCTTVQLGEILTRDSRNPGKCESFLVY